MKVEVLSFVISYHKLDKMAAAMISTELRSTGPKRDRRPGPDRPTDRDQDHGPDRGGVGRGEGWVGGRKPIEGCFV